MPETVEEKIAAWLELHDVTIEVEELPCNIGVEYRFDLIANVGSERIWIANLTLYRSYQRNSVNTSFPDPDLYDTHNNHPDFRSRIIDPIIFLVKNYGNPIDRFMTHSERVSQRQ